MARAAVAKSGAKKTGLGVNVARELVAATVEDAFVFGKSKDGIVEALLKQHFALKKSARALFYRSVPNKVFGRPIKQSTKE